MNPGAGVAQRVHEVYPDLGPGERRVADFVLDHAAELPGYTGAELAEVTGASKATVSRFFRRLGFASFAQARSAARTRGVPVGEVAGTGGRALVPHLAQDRRNLDRLADTLAHDALDGVVQRITDARQVLVVGWRNSYPVALHLREQLVQARSGVALGPLPGQTVAEELTGLDGRDVLLVVGFRRRPPVVAQVVRAAREVGIPTVLLADPTARRSAPLVENLLEVPVDGPGAFDSYAAAMALCAVLAERVLARRDRDGRARSVAVTRMHAALGELETP